MSIHLDIDPADLAPVIRAAVEEAIAALDADRTLIGDRLAVGEAEAARLLSLHPHQLRDERLRGRIKASLGPGRKILYSREDLLEYLRSRRWEKNGG
jgi:hypothetical protein